MAPISASALDFLRCDPDDPMPDVAIQDDFGIGIWLSDPDISYDVAIGNGVEKSIPGDVMRYLPYPVPRWFPPPDPDWDMERLISCDWERIEKPSGPEKSVPCDASCLAKLQRWLILPLVAGGCSFQPEAFASCMRGLIVRRTVLASDTPHFLALTSFCKSSDGLIVDKGVWWTVNTTNLDEIIRISLSELGLGPPYKIIMRLQQRSGVANRLVAMASRQFGP